MGEQRTTNDKGKRLYVERERIPLFERTANVMKHETKAGVPSVCDTRVLKSHQNSTRGRAKELDHGPPLLLVCSQSQIHISVLSSIRRLTVEYDWLTQVTRDEQSTFHGNEP